MKKIDKYFQEYKSTIMEKIHNTFNPKKNKNECENEYTPSPKIQSTVKPFPEPTFNEIAQSIHKELKKIKNC